MTPNELEKSGDGAVAGSLIVAQPQSVRMEATNNNNFMQSSL
jgi:hypothetical protein